MTQDAGTEPVLKPEPAGLPAGLFDPHRVATPAELASVEFVAHSLAFWTARIHALSCPACGVTGTLTVTDRCYCVFVTCMRAECPYNAEIVFARTGRDGSAR